MPCGSRSSIRTPGTGLELTVIAAVVVGGTWRSRAGAERSSGTLFGVLLLGTIGAALVFLRAESQWEKAIQGLIILVAVAFDGFSTKAEGAWLTHRGDSPPAFRSPQLVLACARASRNRRIRGDRQELSHGGQCFRRLCG